MAETFAIKDHDKLFRALTHGRSFNTYGKLSGASGDFKDAEWTGRLPKSWADQFLAWRNEINYVVYSYVTPIAWHLRPRKVQKWNPYRHVMETVNVGGEWVVPDVKYSVTTSKHQNKVRAALWQSYREELTS